MANQSQNDVSRETIHQLDAYLAGRLSEFTISLDLSDVSAPLQKWLNIPQNHSLWHDYFLC